MSIERLEADNTWPEQDAAEGWWQKHRLELKEAVSEYRIETERKLREIREIVLMEGPPPGADSKMILIERVLGLVPLPPDSDLPVTVAGRQKLTCGEGHVWEAYLGIDCTECANEASAPPTQEETG